MAHDQQDDYAELPRSWHGFFDSLFQEEAWPFMVLVLLAGMCCLASPFGLLLGTLGTIACRGDDARHNAATILVVSLLQTVVIGAALSPYFFR